MSIKPVNPARGRFGGVRCEHGEVIDGSCRPCRGKEADQLRTDLTAAREQINDLLPELDGTRSMLTQANRELAAAQAAVERLVAAHAEIQKLKDAAVKEAAENLLLATRSEADNVRLREALRKYGRHLDGCRAHYNMTRDDARCTCGYTVTLAPAAEKGG